MTNQGNGYGLLWLYVFIAGGVFHACLTQHMTNRRDAKAAKTISLPSGRVDELRRLRRLETAIGTFSFTVFLLMAAIVYPFVVGDERLSLVEFMRVDETAVLIPFIGAVAFGGLCFVAFRLRRDLEVVIDGALREEADYQDAIAGRWFTH